VTVLDSPHHGGLGLTRKAGSNDTGSKDSENGSENDGENDSETDANTFVGSRPAPLSDL